MRIMDLYLYYPTHHNDWVVPSLIYIRHLMFIQILISIDPRMARFSVNIFWWPTFLQKRCFA